MSSTGLKLDLHSRRPFRMTLAQFSRYFMCCVFCTLFFVGCVPNRAYRRGDDVAKQPPQPVGPDEPPPSAAPAQLPPISGDACLGGKKQPWKFRLAYIEFDDMGELWSIGDLNNLSDGDLNNPKGTSQLNNALTVIRAAKQEAKSTDKQLDVVTFIHGWQNNASPYDEHHKDYSLAGFESSLQQLTCDPVPRVVVGVFIAWRGQILSGKPLDYLTYWNRRDAAVRVGGPSMTEVLLQLMFETKGVQSSPDPDEQCHPKGLDPRAHFVAIGHSFGARVLEHAMGQPLLAMFLEQKREADACANKWHEKHPEERIKPTLQPPADLIVFLNPANDAFETKSMIEAFKRSRITRDKDKDTPPLLISITSQGDLATQIAMPIAQKLSTQGIGFRQYDRERCWKGQLHLHYQTNFWRYSDGNIREMNSDEVELVKPDDKEFAQCSHAEWPYFTATVKKQDRCFRIKRLHKTSTSAKHANCYQEQASQPWNDTPFWVIKVPSELVPSHTDIFQGGTIQLLITIASHYDMLKPPKAAPETPPADQCDVRLDCDCTLGHLRGY